MILDFVSRGGLKLQHALEYFKIDVKDKVCADLGSSTGGFVDCLLKNGAKKVYSVDTSYGELAWGLRNDSRVVVMERTNALHVELPELCDFISVDVGWTKQGLVLPVVFKNLKEDGQAVSLLKPHYEFNEPSFKEEVLSEGKLSEIKSIVEESGLKLKGIVKSPITGSRGKNVEFLLFLVKC